MRPPIAGANALVALRDPSDAMLGADLNIRLAIGEPDGESAPAAVLAVDEMASAMGYIVVSKASAPQGSGCASRSAATPGGPTWGRGRERPAVARLSGPTLTVTMSVGVFALLGGGPADRVTLRDQIEIRGDEEPGERLVGSLRYKSDRVGRGRRVGTVRAVVGERGS